MNWLAVGAIALAAIALLGIGGAILSTGTGAPVVPGAAISGASVGSEAQFCTPGTFGCESPGP
jgi:hypothetical protein